MTGDSTKAEGLDTDRRTEQQSLEEVDKICNFGNQKSCKT